MAKRAVSYEALSLVAPLEAPKPEPAPQPVATRPATLKDVSHQLMVYLNPPFVKELAQQALARSSHRNKVKSHDLIVEALENWAKANGITIPVRAMPKRVGKGANQPGLDLQNG